MRKHEVRRTIQDLPGHEDPSSLRCAGIGITTTEVNLHVAAGRMTRGRKISKSGFIQIQGIAALELPTALDEAAGKAEPAEMAG